MPLFHTFVDSDFAIGEYRKSISGYIVTCAGGPICWSSKQQTVVALSSCEAEYFTCGHGGRQILSLRSLFEELGIVQDVASVMFCDSSGAVSYAHDPHSRMKHIDIRRHFIR